MIDGINSQRPILGKEIDYLVSNEIKEDQTSWSHNYQKPIVSFSTFFRVEDKTRESGALIGTFKPISNVYSSANPEIENIYLLEKGVVKIGKSYTRIDGDSHRITIMPKGNRLIDLVELARELNLPHEVPEFKRYYNE